MTLPKYLLEKLASGTNAPDGDFVPGGWTYNLDGDLVPPRAVTAEQAKQELKLLTDAWNQSYAIAVGYI